MTDLVAAPEYRLRDPRTLDFHEDELPGLALAYPAAASLRARVADKARALVGAVDGDLPAGVVALAIAYVREDLGRLDALARKGARQALGLKLVKAATEFATARAMLGPVETDRGCAGDVGPFVPRRCRFRAKLRVEIGTPEAPVESAYCKRHAEKAAEKAAKEVIRAACKRLGIPEDGYGGIAGRDSTAAERAQWLRQADKLAREVIGVDDTLVIEFDFVQEWGAIE